MKRVERTSREKMPTMSIENLSGRVGVVTGAASGIGTAMAERFAAEGMRVVLADIEEAALASVVDRLSNDGAAVLGVCTDVTNADALEDLAQQAVSRFGTVHVVCNNAGVGGHHYPSWEAPLSYWSWVLSVSLWGVIHGIRSFLPILLAQDEGHLVNTASIAGLMGIPYIAPYVAAKHAVVGISESLFDELAAMESSVGVSVLCPGAVQTRFGDADRNWPSSFGSPPTSAQDPRAQAVHKLVREGVTAGVAPSRVAQLVVDAIQTGRFMVLTEDEFAPQALAAFSAAIDGGPPTPRRFI